MKTNFIALLLLMNFAVIPVFGVQMHYANTIHNGKTYTDDAWVGKVIKVDHENPKKLNILNIDYELDAPLSSAMTAPNSWEEHYSIKKTCLISRRQGISQIRTVGIVTLYKNRDDGVVGVAFCDHTGRKHMFHPANGQRLDVTLVPDIFINRVQLANVRADGEFINNFDSVMERTDMECLKVSAVYQKSSNDKDVEFLFQVVTKNGEIIKSIRTSEANDNALATSTIDAKENIQVCIQFSKEELNRIEKGNRLEIYAEGTKLCSVDIPIRGKIIYKPTLVARVRTGVNDSHNVPFNPGNSIYGEPMMIKQPIFMCGQHQYNVLEWREIEL